MRIWIERFLLVVVVIVFLLGFMFVGGLAIGDQMAAEHAFCGPDPSRC